MKVIEITEEIMDYILSMNATDAQCIFYRLVFGIIFSYNKN